jgi:pre-rRNA-processing protein IPI3
MLWTFPIKISQWGELFHYLSTDSILKQNSSKVTTLALTATSRLLIGTSQGQINIYDTASLQLIKTIQTSQSTPPVPVTFLNTLSKPVDLVGHVQLSVNGRPHEESIPVRPVLPFARARDTKGKGREVSMVLPNRPVSRKDV